MCRAPWEDGLATQWSELLTHMFRRRFCPNRVPGQGLERASCVHTGRVRVTAGSWSAPSSTPAVLFTSCISVQMGKPSPRLTNRIADEASKPV